MQNLISVDGDLWIKRIVFLSLASILVLAAADVLFVHFGLFPSRIVVNSFNIAKEKSLGTWLSTTQSLLVGLTALAICAHSSKHNNVATVLGWGVIALFFLFVSMDDAAKIHERLGTAVRIKFEKQTDTEISDFFPSYGWQLFVAPLFVLMGFYIMWFSMRAVDKDLRKWVFAALALYGFAVGLDFIEGQLRDSDLADSSRHLFFLVEESIEMVGTTTFLYVFLTTLSRRVKLHMQDTFA